MYLFSKYFKILFCLLIILGCENDQVDESFVISDYSGSYRNVEFTETLVGNFTPGIYREAEIPDALKQMTHGRMEIDFTYMGGALASFMPILYYGSINKKEEDNAVEETQFHLVVEIGHYNVIPFPVENLFYTICYDRYPLYCRDTYLPVISGENYTFVLDKRPEGIILQLRKGKEIVNSLPSAFFPDSTQLFFRDVTRKIMEKRGDSLDIVFMIGQGYVGFDKGLRSFTGQVPEVRIYQYEISEGDTGYELYGVKNQHFAGQQIKYSVRDNLFGKGSNIRLKYDFQPYVYAKGRMTPAEEIRSSILSPFPNDQSSNFFIRSENIGLYEIYLETLNADNRVINSTRSPFSIWIYPEAWEFDY